MVLNRRHLSAVLLLFGAAVATYVVLLTIVASGSLAQGSGATTGEPSDITTNDITINQGGANVSANPSRRPRRPRRERTIVNIPNKPLPPTGGVLPVPAMVVSSVFTGACLLGLGIGIRREQRRRR